MDDDGETVFPEVNAFGGGYRPERVEETLQGFNQELHQVRIAFVKFKRSQDLPTQLDIARYSTLSFLQSTDAEVAFRDMIDVEQREDESNLTLGHGDGAAGTSRIEDQIHVEELQNVGVNNRTTTEEVPIIDDLSIFNPGTQIGTGAQNNSDQHNGHRERIILQDDQESVVNPQADQAHAGHEGRRRRREHENPQSDEEEVVFNPERKPQSSKVGSEASIQSHAGNMDPDF